MDSETRLLAAMAPHLQQWPTTCRWTNAAPRWCYGSGWIPSKTARIWLWIVSGGYKARCSCKTTLIRTRAPLIGRVGIVVTTTTAGFSEHHGKMVPAEMLNNLRSYCTAGWILVISDDPMSQWAEIRWKIHLRPRTGTESGLVAIKPKSNDPDRSGCQAAWLIKQIPNISLPSFDRFINRW